MIGRDLTNNSVLVVENQLTLTDHGHLGQLVTYAANTDAATVIWIALSFSEEHRQAIEFLNDLSGEKVRFFGVEIGAVRIGDSVPAPRFTVVARPNDARAQASADAKASSPEDASGKSGLYAAFWDRFLEQLRTRHPGWTRARKGQAANWMTLPSPFKDLNVYGVNFPSRPQRLRCELYIDSADALIMFESYFDALYAHRTEIETAFGAELSWEVIEGKRASRIATYMSGDVSQVDRHDDFIEWLITSLERLRAALDPHAPEILSLPQVVVDRPARLRHPSYPALE